MDYVVKSNDTPSKLAKLYDGDEGKWPELCKANPQLKTHPDWGCIFVVGKTIQLPNTWRKLPTPVAPVPGPVPQPIGPPIPTPDGSTTASDASPGLIAGLDTKKVMIGGAIVAGLIVLVYSMKKKTKAAAAA